MTTVRSLKSVFFMSLVIVTLTISFAHSDATEAPEAKTAPQQQSVAELQQERLAVLEQLVKYATNDYQNARAGIEKVLEAQQQLLEAKLELAENHESRLKILAESVKLWSQLEEVAKARKMAGLGTETDVLQCKANRLKAEIALQREHQKPQ